MTGTVVDSLSDATTGLNNATAAFNGVVTRLESIADSAQSSATTVITNFLAAPPSQTVWIDPLNGIDTNDGKTAATAKRSIDTVLDNMGITGTTIMLMGDTVIQRRRNVYAGLAIFGVQPSGAAPGWTFTQRKVGFLGTATNSPELTIGTFCSGIWFFGGSSFQTNNITFDLPAQPAGQTYSAHLHSNYGVNMNILATLLVDDPSAGSLFGSSTNTLNVFAGLALGPNAGGHVFLGVASGANPNSSYSYHTNLQTA